MRKKVKKTLPVGTCHQVDKFKISLLEASEVPQEAWIFIKNILRWRREEKLAGKSRGQR